MKETIQVEKEVYEAVLRNSVKVADLEAENMQLRQFCEEFNALKVSEENQKLKELLRDCYEFLMNRDVIFKRNSQYLKLAEQYHYILNKIDEVLK